MSLTAHNRRSNAETTVHAAMSASETTASSAPRRCRIIPSSPSTRLGKEEAMGRVRAVHRWSRPVVALMVGLSLALTACGGGSAGSSSSGSALSLVAFSVPKPAYDELQKNFADSPDGKGVTWKSSYGASGDQARAVLSGLPADYVGFSLSSDMTKLVERAWWPRT